MKTKRRRYDVEAIRKNYEIERNIHSLTSDIPHCDFEKLKYMLMGELLELNEMKNGTRKPH